MTIWNYNPITAFFLREALIFSIYYGDMTMSKDTYSRLKKHLQNKNIDVLDDRNDLPVGLVRNEMVPLRGSIHISSGRVAKRSDIDKKFSKIKFV